MVSAETILAAPPSLASWQAQLGDLLMGPGTPYDFSELEGLDELPELRTSDEPRPWSHGTWAGDDWASGRTLTWTIEVEPTPTVTVDEALADLRRTMVPTPSGQTVPLWLNLPRLGRMVRFDVKIRRHRVLVDQSWVRGAGATAIVQVFAPDPIGYTAGQQASTGFAQAGGGLEFPLFNSGICLLLDGVSPGRASTPDAAALDIVGDIDLRAHVALDDWTPATTQALVAKWTTSGSQRSYLFRVNTGGALQLFWSADGTTLLNAVSTVNPTVADHEPLWVGATLDVDNGAAGRDVKFYTSPDGVTWTQLGATVTTAGVTSILNSTSEVAIGAIDSGTSNRTAGRVFSAEVRNGIGGTVVANPDFAAQTAGTTSFADGTGKTWTIVSPAVVGGDASVNYLVFGAAGTSGRVELANAGTAESWPIYSVAGPTPVEGFESVDVPTGHRIRYDGFVPSGSMVEINTATGSVILDGVADRSSLVTVREWTAIPAGGTTTVAFVPLGSSGSAICTVVWAPAWW